MSIKYNEVGFISVYNENVGRPIQAMYVMELSVCEQYIKCSATHWNGLHSKMIEAGKVLQNIREIDSGYKHREKMMTNIKNIIKGMAAEDVSDFEDDENWSKIGIKVVL